MTNRTRSEFTEIVQYMELFMSNGLIKKKKCKTRYIDINMIELILISFALRNIRDSKFKKMIQKSIIITESGEPKFNSIKLKVINDDVFINTTLKTIPDNELHMPIDKFLELKVIDSIKLKISNNITNELYRLLYSSHSSYIIIQGLQYKLGKG